MALIVGVGDILHLRIWSSFEAQAACTNAHYRVITAIPNAFLEDWATGMEEYFHAGFKTAMAINAQFEGVQLAIVGNQGESAAANSNLHKGPGTFVGGSGILPTQLRFLLKARVPMAFGKGGHIRKYIPFPDIEAYGIPSNSVNPAAMPVLTALATLFGPAITIAVKGQNGQALHVLYRKATKETFDAPGLEPSERFATQRRAGFYGKANQSPV